MGKYNQSNHHFERHQHEPTHSHEFVLNQSIPNGLGVQSLTRSYNTPHTKRVTVASQNIVGRKGYWSLILGL